MTLRAAALVATLAASTARAQDATLDEHSAAAPNTDEGTEATQTPRERRRARRQARFEGPVLPPEADFLQTHRHVGARIAFNGTSPGPFSLFTALAGWNEFGLSIEGGIASWRDFTITMGIEGHYGAAWVPAVLSQRVADTGDARFRWSAWEAGGSLRAAFHFTRLFSVDPWIGGGLGVAAFRMNVRVAEPVGVDPQRFTVPYLRGEIAVGLNVPLQRGFVVGGEIRYLLTGMLPPVDRLRFRLPDDNVASFVLFPQHRPPKGFSWVFTVGYRF